LSLIVLFACQGERLYPHTAAVGRDKIRTELRHLRDRWDEVEVRLNEMQKKREVLAQHKSSLQESLQQTKAWLDAMEKTVAQEITNNVAPSDVRSRLVKIKTVQQEVASHWRLVENVKSKAAEMSSAQEIADAIADVGDRYDALVDTIKVNFALLLSTFI
jgi:vacuolar-type H+-ATPase subunit I/STV1